MAPGVETPVNGSTGALGVTGASVGNDVSGLVDAAYSAAVVNSPFHSLVT